VSCLSSHFQFIHIILALGIRLHLVSRLRICVTVPPILRLSARHSN
jgi:hypothetical protein